MKPACPSDLALERHLLDRAGSGIAEHLGACAGCAARLARMVREGEQFEREVYPRTAQAVIEAAARPHPALSHLPRAVKVAVPLAAAAAVAAYLVVPWLWPGRQDEVALSVYLDEAAGPRPLRDGERVSADATLRFAVEPRSPCCLWVLSVNAAGEIARVYPPKGDDEWEVYAPKRHELPVRLPLDGRPGPQRIFAICTPRPVPWPAVKQAATETLRPGEQGVRELRGLGRLPEPSSESTVLVEKRG